MDGYLHSDALESYEWSSAPYLSDTEFTTLQYLRRQFISSKHQSSNSRMGLYRIIRPIGRFVDPELFDIFFRAYEKQVGWTPEPDPVFDFMPYTLDSVRDTVCILGRPFSERIITDKDFLKLSSDDRDQMCEEEVSYRTILKIINKQYINLHSAAPASFRLDSIFETIRNHPLYQVRKHLTIYYSKTAVKMDYPWYVHSHVDKRDRLVYAR